MPPEPQPQQSGPALALLIIFVPAFLLLVYLIGQIYSMASR